MKFSSLSLLWKILLSTSVALTALFAGEGWVITYRRGCKCAPGDIRVFRRFVDQHLRSA
jgi:hypothetical protein